MMERDIVDRLRAEKAESLTMHHAQGRDTGKAWAKQASYDELFRVEQDARDWQKGVFPDSELTSYWWHEGSYYGGSWIFIANVLPGDPLTEPNQDLFEAWEQCRLSKTPTTKEQWPFSIFAMEYIEGFFEGALEFWWSVKPLIDAEPPPKELVREKAPLSDYL